MIEVCPCDELVEFCGADVFSEFLGDPLEVLNSNETCFLVIEQVKDLSDVFSGITVIHLLC